MTRSLIAAALLGACSLTLAQTVARPTGLRPLFKPKVLVIGVDGLRTDAMFASGGQTFGLLTTFGQWTDRAQANQITVSGPCWSSILCGVWSDRHGVTNNSFTGRRYDLYPHFFQRLRQVRPDLKLAHYVSWEPLDTIILGSFQPDYRLYHPYTQNGDEVITNAAVSLLRDTDVDVTFFYLSDVDVAGHNFGFHPAVPEYLAEIRDNDRQIGRLLTAIQSRPTYGQEDWMILTVTDHGGTIDGSHGRDEPAHREIFFCVSGDSIVPGYSFETVNQPDVPATVFAFLGLTPNRAWNWDGMPFGLPKAPPANGANLLRNGDAEAADGYTGYTPNAGIPGWTDLGAATVVRYGSTGFPAVGSPGPADRGQSFFCGGSASPSRTTEISQVVELQGRWRDIRRGALGYEFSGWLGGRGSDRDLASATARFLDRNGGLLATARLGPVNRQARGNVPRDTSRVEVRVTFEAGSGDNDGYADNLSFKLTDVTRVPL